MAYRTLANSIAAFSLLFAATFADDGQQPPKKPVPVRLSARFTNTESNVKKTIEISLAIGNEYEIYSERKHEFLLPQRAELLDAKLQSIKSKVLFPEPKTIPFDKDLGGDYFVYHGKPKIAATCAAKAKPAYVRVFYHGYSTRGY